MRGMAVRCVIAGCGSVQGVDMADMFVARFAVNVIAVAMRMACRPRHWARRGAGCRVTGGGHPAVI